MFSALCISGFFHFLQTAVFAVGYISGTSLFPEPLSSEEERIYLEKLSTGDEEARNILIEKNLRLVAHVCKKYASTNKLTKLPAISPNTYPISSLFEKGLTFLSFINFSPSGICTRALVLCLYISQEPISL